MRFLGIVLIELHAFYGFPKIIAKSRLGTI